MSKNNKNKKEGKEITCLEAFPGPYKLDPCAVYIWCEDGARMCFTVMHDYTNQEELERLKRAIDLLNGKKNAKPFEHVGYDFESGFIGIGDTLEEASHAVLLMRGWGYLTGIGGLHLPAKKAVELQNDFMKFAMRRLLKRDVDFDKNDETGIEIELKEDEEV